MPLRPWLIPAVVPAVGRLAPFVQSVTLPGGIQISLQAVARPVAGLGTVGRALTADHLVHGITTTDAPFTTTDAMTVIDGVRAVRAAGAPPAVVVDLAAGVKWRLPKFYFLMWILANDPVTRWVAFTETRGQTPRVTQHRNQQQLTGEFNKLRAAVAPSQAERFPALAWISATELRGLLGPHLAAAAVDWTGELTREGLETIVRAGVPYVAATTPDGRFRGVIDQRSVALEFARRALESQ